jgi:hypothetical protein
MTIRSRRLPPVAVIVAVLVAGCASEDGRTAPRVTAAPTSATASAPVAELPEPRTEVGGTAWRGLVAVAGGLTADGSVSSRFDLYNPQANQWTPGPSLPLPLHHLGMATLDDRLYVAGGYTVTAGGQSPASARVMSLGPSDTSWREEPPLSRPRGALGLAAVRDRLVAVGGVTGQVSASTESWSPGEASWRSGPDLAQAREHLAVASANGRVYAIAGRLGGLDTNLRSVESWDGAEPRWRSEPALAHARGGTSAATVTGVPCVAGGEEPRGTIGSVECLSGTRWDRVTSLSVARHGLAVAGLGSRLHVIAGGTQPGLHVSGTHEVLTIG